MDGTTGWWAGTAHDSIILHTDDGTHLAWPVDSITTVEVVSGRGSHWARGMGLGGLIGAVAGGILGAVVVEQDAFLGPAGGALAGVIIGAPAGLVIGGVVGATRPTERWGELPDADTRRYHQADGRCGPHIRVRARGNPLIGAAAGLAVGGVAGRALANTTKEYTGLVVAGGVALGALVGQLIRSDRWERVSPSQLQVGIAPHPGGLSLTATLRL